MFDPNVLLAAGTLFTGAVVVVFFGGRQVGRIEASVSRMLKIELALQKVDEHTKRISTLEDAYEHVRRDTKALMSERAAG